MTTTTTMTMTTVTKFQQTSASRPDSTPWWGSYIHRAVFYGEGVSKGSIPCRRRKGLTPLLIFIKRFEGSILTLPLSTNPVQSPALRATFHEVLVISYAVRMSKPRTLTLPPEKIWQMKPCLCTFLYCWPMTVGQDSMDNKRVKNNEKRDKENTRLQKHYRVRQKSIPWLFCIFLSNCLKFQSESLPTYLVILCAR